MSLLSSVKAGIFSAFASAAIFLAPVALRAQQPTPAPGDAPAAAAAAESTKPANFRAPAAALATADPAAAPGELSPVPTGNSQQDLIDRRDSLIADIGYAKAKLEAGRKLLSIKQAVGRGEDADRINVELKDW